MRWGRRHPSGIREIFADNCKIFANSRTRLSLTPPTSQGEWRECGLRGSRSFLQERAMTYRRAGRAGWIVLLAVAIVAVALPLIGRADTGTLKNGLTIEGSSANLSGIG